MTRARLALFLLASLLVLALAAGLAAPDRRAAEARFAAIDVFLDPATSPLAAWQVEVRLAHGAKLAGVEGGEPATVFAAPPTYDPAALMNDRVIIAAFTLEPAARLPTQRTRIARLHVQLPAGAPAGDAALAAFAAVVQTAANDQAEKIDATAALAPAATPGDDQ